MNIKMTKNMIDTAVSLYREGMSTPQIGKILGVSHKTILSNISKEGVAIRGGCGRRRERLHDRVSRKAVAYAISRGLMKKPDCCEVCKKPERPHKNGSSGLHAHHDDYNYPLSVRWMCMKCHYKWHYENTAIPRDPNKDIDISFMHPSFSGIKRRSDCKSKHPGVLWRADRGTWIASINVNGKKKYLGSSKTEQGAAEICARAEQKLKVFKMWR